MLLGPGTPKRLSKQYDIGRSFYLRRNSRVPNMRRYEGVLSLIQAGKVDEARACQKKHGVKLTREKARMVMRDRQRPAIFDL